MSSLGIRKNRRINTTKQGKKLNHIEGKTLMTFKKIIDRLALAGVMSVLLAAAAFGQKTAEKPLPNLALDNINGQKWNLEEMRGSVVLLNFWATWCAPCRTEIPALVSLSNKYKTDGLKIVGVSVDSENVAQINKFIKEFKIDYPIVLAIPGSLLSQQKAIPMSLLIDEKGVLAKKYIGAIKEADLEKDIRELLKKDGSSPRKSSAGIKKDGWRYGAPVPRRVRRRLPAN